MVSFTTSLLALASAIVVTADYWIDPSSVSLGDRMVWCRDQTSACPIICQQVAPGPILVNNCEPETLMYGCLCSNGLQPNMSEYSMTIPYHTCQTWGTQCVKDCGSDSACQSSCREDHPCGAQNPTRVNSTSSTTMPATASASASGTKVYTGLAGETTDDSSSSNNDNKSAASALQFGQAYGLVVVMASLFAGFAIMV
ncbi:hypothetical protein B0H66DRAFT_596958 [Apodospora peruviana]|uniref:DUF7707 domain-containing protein n=1 Tax=Apodospora peruviana TaxID=516989 RepID=A0AAE0MF32_9PEZI|nr:hypothetical protein B0H66DRAFT_596958 [Apodospora peruviana]